MDWLGHLRKSGDCAIELQSPCQSHSAIISDIIVTHTERVSQQTKRMAWLGHLLQRGDRGIDLDSRSHSNRPNRADIIAP
jgi:hypothetical protein